MMTMNVTPAQTAAPASSRLDRFLRGAGLNILLVTASGLLASFAFPPYEAWWLAWVSLAPLFIALRRTAAVRASGWLMLCFGMVFFAATLTWLASIFGIGVVGIYVMASLPWILFGVAYRVAGGSKLGAWTALLAPVLFLAVEWFRCEGWYFQFSWGQLGYVFASCRRGGVLYPYIGVYGATFLIVLVNALLAELALARASLAKKALLLIPFLLTVLPLSLYMNQLLGIPRLSRDAGHLFRVAIIQNETGALESLAAQTRRVAFARPALIVWPEYAVMDYPLSKPRVFADIQAVARDMHCTLVLGCKEHVPNTARVDFLRRRAMMSLEGELFHNTALVIGPRGELLGKYAKTHPIQFFSDGVPGHAFPSFNTPVGRLGIAICYDFDYAGTVRKLIRNGAEVLVAPTYDSTEWPEVQHLQHARMAQARAAESGRWMIRATTSGISQVITPDGQMTSYLPATQAAYIIGEAASRSEITPYMHVGYLLPALCIAVSLLWLCWSVLTWLQRFQTDRQHTRRGKPR